MIPSYGPQEAQESLRKMGEAAKTLYLRPDYAEAMRKRAEDIERFKVNGK